MTTNLPLTAYQEAVLSALKGEVMTADLAESIGLTTRVVGQVILGLFTRGLIDRRQVEDGRYLWRLTRQGREAAGHDKGVECAFMIESCQPADSKKPGLPGPDFSASND